ncbi:vesicle-associated membrane protein 1 [Scomber scombrus]|uniref:Vesicle-associated membrane protein 1 n=1 Tax=Scomber scombrus TaxID=13677 RepID=A0AAV1P3L4_SCOSC
MEEEQIGCRLRGPLRNETRAIAKRNVMQEQVEEGDGENPRPGSKQSSQHYVGIHCTAVSSCRPIRHRAAVLQSARGERERRRRGGRGVLHCRYESKWRRQEERRIIAAAYSAITLSRTEQPHFDKTHVRLHTQREREREREKKERESHHTVNYHPTQYYVSRYCVLYFRPSLSCLSACHPSSAARESAPDAAAPGGAPGAPGAPGADGAPGGGPPAPPNTSSNRRLQQTQAQVEEVVDIMRVNVDKVLERDQKLSELDDRADALQAGASQFESCAAKLKNKYWWKNCKMMIMMGIIGVIVVGIIFLYFFY